MDPNVPLETKRAYKFAQKEWDAEVLGALRYKGKFKQQEYEISSNLILLDAEKCLLNGRQVATHEDFTEPFERIRNLERKIVELETRMTNLAAQYRSLDTRLTLSSPPKEWNF